MDLISTNGVPPPRYGLDFQNFDGGGGYQIDSILKAGNMSAPPNNETSVKPFFYNPILRKRESCKKS